MFVSATCFPNTRDAAATAAENAVMDRTGVNTTGMIDARNTRTSASHEMFESCGRGVSYAFDRSVVLTRGLLSSALCIMSSDESVFLGRPSWTRTR